MQSNKNFPLKSCLFDKFGSEKKKHLLKVDFAVLVASMPQCEQTPWIAVSFLDMYYAASSQYEVNCNKTEATMEWICKQQCMTVY